MDSKYNILHTEKLVIKCCLGNGGHFDDLTIIGSDSGLSPGRRAPNHYGIIWTNAEILFIGPLGKNFN